MMLKLNENVVTGRIKVSCKLSVFLSHSQVAPILSTCTLLHSLEWNAIGDSGAHALADALRVNKSLKTLK